MLLTGNGTPFKVVLTSTDLITVRKCYPLSAFSSLYLMRSAVRHLKKSDPILAAIIDSVGPCRMQYGPPEFHSLAEAIVYQQLNGKAAVKIFKRFTDLAGDPVTRQGILKLTDAQLRAAGLKIVT